MIIFEFAIHVRRKFNWISRRASAKIFETTRSRRVEEFHYKKLDTLALVWVLVLNFVTEDDTMLEMYAENWKSHKKYKKKMYEISYGIFIHSNLHCTTLFCLETLCHTNHVDDENMKMEKKVLKAKMRWNFSRIVCSLVSCFEEYFIRLFFFHSRILFIKSSTRLCYTRTMSKLGWERDSTTWNFVHLSSALAFNSSISCMKI